MNYDAYGNQWQGDTPDPFGYCGEYYDTESGLIYLRNRYYESETGRFITEDPAKDGLNWYSYCAGNPVVLVDPSGLLNVPKKGVKTINEIINEVMGIMCDKVDYESGKTDYKRNHAKKSADKKRKNLEEMLPEIKEFSPELANSINENVISGKGTLQMLSSIVALCVETRYDIINYRYVSGEKVFPEEKVDAKIQYYRNSGDIFLAGDDSAYIKNKILSKSDAQQSVIMQDVYTGKSPLLGYWVKIVLYDKQKMGMGDAFNFEQEDLPIQN